MEDSITRGRDLAQVVHPVAESPSEDALARAVAAHGEDADPAALLMAAGVGREARRRIEGRIEVARAAEAAARAPGPMANPAAIESLVAVPAYGGTTLEEFDLCSYRWFAGHELRPTAAGPHARSAGPGRPDAHDA